MVKYKTVTITPDVAKSWLARKYKGQRRLSKTVVNTYAIDMKKGNWCSEVPDPIMFNKKDELINGQHRLNAIVESGATCNMLVGTGFDDEVYTYLDNGHKRTLADYMGVDAKTSATVTGVIYAFEKGTLPLKTSCRGSIKADYKRAGSIKSTRHEYLAFYEENKERLDDYTRKVRKIRNALRVGSTMTFASFLWLCGTLGDDPEFVDVFVDDLCKIGGNVTTESMKNTILKAYTQDKKPTNEWVLGILLQGYDAYCLGVIPGSFNKANRYLRVFDDRLAKYRESKGVRD